MHVSVLSVFPSLYKEFLDTSLIKRSQEKGLIDISVDSYFNYVRPGERIDSDLYGVGPGMLLKPVVMQAAIEHNEKQYGDAYKIFLSPQGKRVTQPDMERLARVLASKKHLMLVTSRYEGVDQRVEEVFADEVISLGDFVILGGDLPAMVLLEGVIRLIPGVVGKTDSVKEESFSGPFLDFPSYTSPVVWHDKHVPDVVRSGDHGKLAVWRHHAAIKKTVKYAFSWLKEHRLVSKDKLFLIKEIIPSHYVALVHGDVLVSKEGKPGTTSVTSIDIHDISRASSTYGIKQFGIITPLVDQQRIVETLLQFWGSHGISYNKNRHEALQIASIHSTVDDFIAFVENKEGKKPLLIATSALCSSDPSRVLSYMQQSLVWSLERPIILFFGTGQGLSPAFLSRCDYQLLPIEGLTDFNHLSVRSAVAVILDRWLGICYR